MQQQIINTFSSKYFPTSQFNLDTKQPGFIELRESLKSIKGILETIIPLDKYRISVNTGVGKIASCPWIGIHSTRDGFDSQAQTGLYLTLIWNYDGSGLCMSFQKGANETKTDEVIRTVERIRSKYGKTVFRNSISLNAPKQALRPKSYEIANIYGKNYTSNNISELLSDLNIMEKYYAQVVNGKAANLEIIKKMEQEELEYQSLTPKKKSSSSTSWVRNPQVRLSALENANYKCQMDNEHKTFMTNGHMFMEGHHLIPMEYQVLFDKQTLDIEENIISLCPNCHREIHYAPVSQKLKMVRKIFLEQNQDLRNKLDISIDLLESLYDDI